MPHSTRRRAAEQRRAEQKSGRLKVYEADNDGWSVVARGARSLPPVEALTPGQAAELNIVPPRNAPQPPRYNLQELEKRFGDIRKQWAASSARSQLRTLLERHFAAPELSQAVCLGLGSASHGPTRDVLWQLAVLLDVAAIVCRPDTPIFAQDPVFNTVDVQLLASVGVEALDDPRGFDIIDGKTAVFAPHFPAILWPPAMRAGVPALVIGNDIQESADALPDASELRAMQRQRRVGEKTSRLDQSDLVEQSAKLSIHEQDNRVESERDVPDADVKGELQQFAARFHKHSIAVPELEELPGALTGLRIYWTADKDNGDDGEG